MNEYKRPFLKWAGGKYSQLDFILPLLPKGKRLIEPFVGAGSIFINARGFEEYLLADTNKDLINTYQQLILNSGRVKNSLNRMFSQCRNEEGYRSIVNLLNDGALDLPDRAAAFIYINKWCFNGMVRYNQKGDFNVGFCHRISNPPNPPAQEMDNFIELNLSADSFICQGFSNTIKNAGEGDVIYADTPYLPKDIDIDGNYKKRNKLYSGFHFELDEHLKLISDCLLARERGASIIINNSFSDFTEQLYRKNGFEIFTMPARRSISCKGKTRGVVTDLIARLA